MKVLYFKMQSVKTKKQQEARFIRVQGDSIDDLLGDGYTQEQIAGFAIQQYNDSAFKNHQMQEVINGSIRIVEEPE